MRTVVVALGGSAITREEKAGAYDEQSSPPPRFAADALAGMHGTRLIPDRARTAEAGS